MKSKLKNKIILIILILISSVCSSYALKHTPDHYDYAIRLAFNENRWDAGKYMIDEAEPYYGSLAVFYELKGWYYYHNQDYIQARYNLTKCLNEDNGNTHARTLLSKVEEDTHNYSAAICYINELLENNPYNKSLWIRKISLYLQLNNKEEANKLIKRLAEIYPNDLDVINLLDEQYNANYKLAKLVGDIQSLLSIAKDLISVNPSADNYLLYTNSLILGGYLNKALEISAEGASKTNSFQLIKKHCDILCELGKYQEAINYIDNNYRRNALAIRLKNNIEIEQARLAALYDPYMMYQKLYAKLHNEESFNYVVNTALSRGYYYDALETINDYKKRYPNKINNDVLYKEYTAYYRLGNHNKCAELLDVMAKNDNNATYIEEKCEAYYKLGNDLLMTNNYVDAIAKFEYIYNNSSDSSYIKNAANKLYTCYLETSQYDKALDVLPIDQSAKRAVIYAKKNDYKTALNLAILTDTILYEELSIEYIKKLIDKKDYKEALLQCNKSLVFSDAKELYMYAISSSSKLNKDYSSYVLAGIEKYPKDDYFINQYCGLINKEALQLYKSKNYDDALIKVNDGLEYNSEDKDLLNTKGLIYEKMKQYELSYEYLKSYLPGILDGYEFRKKMQGMLSKTYKNEIDIFYLYHRNETLDSHLSLVGVSYARNIKAHDFSIIGNYSSRDGQHHFALQIGGTYSYSFKYDIVLDGQLLYGSNYQFPRWTAGIGLTKGLPKDWTIGGKFIYKNIDALAETTNMITNNHVYNINVNTSKTVDPVVLTAKTDLFIILKNLYFSINGKVDYFPIEGNKTKLFVGAGLGTAPEVTITDNMLPSAVNKLNTFITGGGNYWFNLHVSFGLYGSWYCLYNLDDNTQNQTNYINLFYLNINTAIRF